MAELLIRASINDHLIISDLLAPASGPRLAHVRPPIDRLVADAHVAAARPILSNSAKAAGIPFLIDPSTPLMQTSVSERDRWVQLPFGQSEALTPSDIEVKSLVEQVVNFELEHGATQVIPPYFYASTPLDPWFLRNLEILDATADYMDRREIRLDLVFVLCVQLQSFCDYLNWQTGIDRVVERLRRVPRASIALMLSPAGAPGDGIAKVRKLFFASRQMISSGLDVLAMKQGIYGPGLVAAGLQGYECGIGTNEQTNVVGQQASHKPRKNDRRGGGGVGIYLDPLRRSLPRRVAEVLLEDLHMRSQLMCEDKTCCRSWKETLNRPREHTVRARRRQLDELNSQPSATVRLMSISRDAQRAAALAEQSNGVLAASPLANRVQTKGYESLAKVTAELAQDEGLGVTA